MVKELIIALRSRLALDSHLPHLVWGIWGTAALMLLLFFILMARFNPIDHTGQELATAPIAVLDHSQILTGPLALKHNPRSPLAMALEQKLLFLAQSLRPDLKKSDRKYCLGIQGSGERQILNEGEKIFFSVAEGQSGGIESLEFSKEPTELALRVEGGDGASLVAYVEKGGEEMELLLTQRGNGGVPKSYPWNVWKLKQAKCWGADAFFQEYGGAEYKRLGQKKRLELDEGKNRQLLLVSNQDFLMMKEDKWEVLSSLSLAEPNAPLARIASVGSKYVEIEAWDEFGFPVFKVKLKEEPQKKGKINVKKLFDSPKLRSAHQFSCNIEKKRMVLKAGDWLVKTKTGWHKLKTLPEIEAVLRSEFGSELLIIDEIDPSGMVRGKLFDDMRTQYESISISISPDKKGKTSKKRGHFKAA